MKNNFIFAVLFLFFVLIACGDKNATESETIETNVTSRRVASSDNAPTGDVFRATLINKDASVQFEGKFTTGNEYTLSFWFYNETGNTNVQAEWSHWPNITDEILLEESAPGEWVYHEAKFTALVGGTLLQIAPEHSTRAANHTFYVANVTITAADGTVQAIPLSALKGHWESSVITTSVVPAP